MSVSNGNRQGGAWYPTMRLAHLVQRGMLDAVQSHHVTCLSAQPSLELLYLVRSRRNASMVAFGYVGVQEGSSRISSDEVSLLQRRPPSECRPCKLGPANQQKMDIEALGEPERHLDNQEKAVDQTRVDLAALPDLC